MQEAFFGQTFDQFRVDVIDRLARIETQHERIIERLDRMNGSLQDHADKLEEHEERLDRLRGAASVLAALVAAAVSVSVSRFRGWLAP
jgi:chromosome segregation ATPase